jgi:hypothetical protein
MLNAGCLLNRNSLNARRKKILFIWGISWDHKKYSLNAGTQNYYIIMCILFVMMFIYYIYPLLQSSLDIMSQNILPYILSNIHYSCRAE